MKVTFEKLKKLLTVSVGEKVVGYFNADSPVLSLAAHSRSRSNIARTYPDDLPYDPSPFPNGSWLITGHHISTNKYVTGAFIETNATRKVRVWSTRHAADGTEIYDAPTVKVVQDGALGLHASNAPTTQGCIKFYSRPEENNDDAAESARFLALVAPYLDKGVKIELNVVD